VDSKLGGDECELVSQIVHNFLEGQSSSMSRLSVIKEQDRALGCGRRLEACRHLAGLFRRNACVGVAALQQYGRRIRKLDPSFVARRPQVEAAPY